MWKIAVVSTILLVFAGTWADGCSSSVPIWSKSANSKTPLFRFVVKVEGKAKAGYIDAKGAIAIPPQFDGDNDYGYDYDDFIGAVVEIMGL